MIPLIIPGLAAGAGAAVGVVTGALSNAAAAYIGNLFTAEQYQAAAKSWEILPIRDPDPTTLFELIRRGNARTQQLSLRSLLRQGIALDSGSEHGELWRAVFRSLWPVPSLADIIATYVRGGITEKQLCERLTEIGVPGSKWVEVIRSSLASLTVEQALPLWLRRLITDDQLTTAIRRNGYQDERYQDLFRKAAMQLPLPQDVIRFAVREAFNDKQAELLGLDLELDENPQFLELARAVGVGVAEYANEANVTKTVDVPKLIWRAHWELPSPTMAYDFLRRLRPNRISRFQATLPPELAKDLKPVTGAELNGLLKAADYAPTWRPRLAAVSYLPLTRVDSRRLFDSQLIDKTELVEQYLDQGYVKADAEKMAEWAESERDLARWREDWTAAKGPILEAYRLGWMKRADAAMALMPLTFRSADALRKWQEKPAAVQEQEALADRRVRSWLLTADTRIRNSIVTQRLGHIQSRLLSGIIDVGMAHAELGALGLAPERVQQWKDKWAGLLSGPRRTYSLRQLLSLFRDGAVSQGELMRRARNLGYSQADILILYRQAGIIASRTAQQQAEREARTAARAERERQRAMGGRAGVAAWRSTLASLEDWFRRGLIDEALLRRILADKSYQQPEIDLIIADLQGGQE